MNNAEHSNVEAIRDCIELTKRYPLETCLLQCQYLCGSLDDAEAFNKLMDAKRRNGCLREITRLACSKYGARNLLSALFYLSGDTEAAIFQFEVYKSGLENVLEEFRRLMRE